MHDDLSGPNKLAHSLEARIAELRELRATLPRSERRPVNQKLHVAAQLLGWCKSRAGYVATLEGLVIS